MNQQRTFEQTLASLYEAMLDDAHWPAASALIDEACGAQGNMLVFGEAASQDEIDVLVAKACYRGVRDRDREREYCEVYHGVDEHLPLLRKLADSRIVRLADLYTDQERKASVIYNELGARNHYQRGLNVRLDGPHGTCIVLALADPVQAGDWSSDQLRMVKRILPHVRQYIRVRSALADVGALRTTLAELLDNGRAGVMHLDRRGHIVAMNDVALDLVREGDCLSDQGGLLRARSPEDDPDLQRVIARSLPRFGKQGRSGSMMVERSNGAPGLAVHVRPVMDREVDVRSRRVGAIVLVVDPEREARIEPELAIAVLNLSPAESEIAVLFARGMSLHEIALRTGRGLGTTRWHMKRILNKVGISRQAQLVQRVLALRGIPGPES